MSRGCGSGWTPTGASSTRVRWRTASPARRCMSVNCCTPTCRILEIVASSKHCPPGSFSETELRRTLMAQEFFRTQEPPVTFNTLPLTPPFALEGLTARVFPLRSSLDALQRFCNSYLNFLPKEIGRFRAFVPYTYMMIIDYGRLAPVVANLGWFAQREI